MQFWLGFVCLLLAAAVAFLAVYVRRWWNAERRRKELEEKVQLQLAAAQAEEERKKDLVAFLAHDLKTPLTSVVGYLTLLRDKPGLSPEERQRYTEVALHKAQRLEQLLGEFFDISRMELRQEEEHWEPVDLTLLLEQVTDEFYPLLGEKDLSLEVRIDQGLSTFGDGEKLARVFDNLLRNAVSYSSPHSAITLTAQGRKGRVEIRVSNQGLAIPEGELASIFQRFYRLDAARSSATGGAGLGLAIAKEIVEAHKGTIAAESTGTTTVFHVALPRTGGSDGRQR